MLPGRLSYRLPRLKTPASPSLSSLHSTSRPPPTPPPPSSSDEDLPSAGAAILSIIRSDPALLPASPIAATPTLLAHLLPPATALPTSSLPALARWALPALSLSPSLHAAFVSLLASRRLFAAAWSLLLPPSPPPPLSTFSPLFRRYTRLGRATSAVRALDFLRRHPSCYTVDESSTSPAPFDVAVDALCKEGHPRAAAELVARRRHEEPGWSPPVHTYNMLLHGWFRARRLDKAEKLWGDMRSAGVRPTVVTYGTLIEGLCRMRRPEQAMQLLDEMREVGIVANPIVCNPIVDSLAEAGRFEDAHKVLEKFLLYGVAPNISTFNSLVKGYCKNGDLAGASKVLMAMMSRGIMPTARTYNYFFRVFAKNGNVELAMNLYSKMVNNSYTPDRLTYHLLIKTLCEENRVELVAQMIREMNANGFEPDLETSTMLVHLLCRSHRFEEACTEFDIMFKRGIVPQYITYRMLMKELKRLCLVELTQKLTDLMRSVPHSTKLPGSYRDKEGDDAVDKRKSVLQKAHAISDVLKECKDPKELSKLRSSEETDVEAADRIVADIRRVVYGVPAG